MTRFDAHTPRERRTLFADAVSAHRARTSPFLTVEVEADPALDGTDDEGETNPAPWVQFSDQTFNLDCTDAELDRLTDLLDDFPEFRIDELTEDDEGGTNVRVTARSDANRLSAFVDRAFQAVYGRDEDYRAWVVQI